jgi:hypothetical protein
MQTYSSPVVITLLVFTLIVLVLYAFGVVTTCIASTHSIKKRVVRGEDFSAGNVFAWYFGWACAMGYSLGLATVIYFLVKRGEIAATKQMHTQILANIRHANAQQAPQQGNFQNYR